MEETPQNALKRKLKDAEEKANGGSKTKELEVFILSVEQHKAMLDELMELPMNRVENIVGFLRSLNVQTITVAEKER